MKLLLDSCVSGQAAVALRELGHDVVWAGDWQPDPGDTEILARCVAESRILVTLDKDSGDLVVVQGQPHPGMIRLDGFRAHQQSTAIAQLVAAYASELGRRAILTAEPWRVRVRLEPDHQE